MDSCISHSACCCASSVNRIATLETQLSTLRVANAQLVATVQALMKENDALWATCNKQRQQLADIAAAAKGCV